MKGFADSRKYDTRERLTILIGIIDYDAGNVKSVSKAVEKLGGSAIISNDTSELDKSSALILPGVGSFGKASQNLRTSGLDTYIKKAVGEGKLLLGICLGMQMLFEKSYEDGEWDGLGFLKGDVVRFGSRPEDKFDLSLKIPHMGWNKLVRNRDDSIGKSLSDNEYAYFVHSYYAVPENKEDVVFFADYSVNVPGVVRRENVIGMQFHPEKSSTAGLSLLADFLRESGEI